MDFAALPDLDQLDSEALKALVIAHRAELAVRQAEHGARQELSVSLFRRIFPAKLSVIFPPRRAIAAPTAAASCGSSAKTSPSNWSTSRRVSRSSAMCGRSLPAAAATASLKHPLRPVPSSAALPGLACLAHVLVSKFADHLPLYRQSEIYARQGVEIERSTLAGWVGASSELLSPLLDALHKHVMGGTKLHAGDGAP
jgi:hypothetical protein